MKQRVWLVTGATAGMGKALADKIYNQGDIIVATTRRKEALSAIGRSWPERSLGIQLDITSSDSIQHTVNTVLEKFGRIDVLVNNAGYGLMGAIEEVSEEEARAQMETNFFGVLKLTQAVLPVMRNQGSGHIIQFSSRVGIVAPAGFGFYAASKFALEAMSEALAAEVAPLNIKVTIVQPGPVRTEFFGGSAQFAQQQIEDYREITKGAREAGEKMHGQQPNDPAKIAEAVINMANMEQPPLRLPLTAQTLSAMEQKIQWLKEDLERWRAVALDTAF